ncbi:hypothetical protein [Yoonia sp.]|uniref:hypothetical protein n=1 Tax=Yoonia sp. TaxID=2212373 RepID=UPI0025CD9619|nr:hypothetical protein [Yoonia sp.]
MRKYFIILAIAATLPTLTQAQCRMAIAGSNCIIVPQTSPPPEPPVAIGDVLERGEYSMLLNARYYGLPSVSDGWVYMRIEDEIYRVDWRSHEVLEQVTDQTNRNW